MKRSLFAKLVAGTAATALFAASASAQILNTGQTGNVVDGNWNFSWAMLNGSSCGSLSFSPWLSGLPAYGFQEPNTAAPATQPTCSQYTQKTGSGAKVVSSPPGVWPANTVQSQWIGASATAFIPGFTPSAGFADAPGDNAMRFLFTYSTSLLGSAAITGNIGWDNMLYGYQFLDAAGGAVGSFQLASGGSWLTPAPQSTGPQKGFCRTGDGLETNASCSSSFSIAYQQGAKSIAFYTLGDGRTDAFRISNATVVPEPSTYALMAAGLLGLGVAARRRRSVTAA